MLTSDYELVAKLAGVSPRLAFQLIEGCAWVEEPTIDGVDYACWVAYASPADVARVVEGMVAVVRTALKEWNDAVR